MLSIRQCQVGTYTQMYIIPTVVSIPNYNFRVELEHDIILMFAIMLLLWYRSYEIIHLHCKAKNDSNSLKVEWISIIHLLRKLSLLEEWKIISPLC